MDNNRFYITTPIYYVNDVPHIGHAYQKIVADVLARWHRVIGDDVFFLTGTDEHGKKMQEAAEKAGKTPEKFVSEMANKFKEAWKVLNIKYDRFIRTTDADHEAVVKDILKKKVQHEGLEDSITIMQGDVREMTVINNESIDLIFSNDLFCDLNHKGLEICWF